MEAGVIKPGKILYVISGLILAGGLILFVVLLVTGIFSAIDKMSNQIVVPGTKTVELKETGMYSIYFEHQSNVDGKVYKTSNINGLQCSLKNTATGEFISLYNTSVHSTYAIPGRAGKSIFEFEVAEPGQYELNAWYESGEGEEAVLVITNGFGMSIVRTILLCIGVLLISLGLSITIFMVTLVKRQKAKRNMVLKPEA